MTEFDIIVLGGGTGNIVASAAAEEGLDVALVERGRLGGTCLNRGCNPSKKLIHRADVAETVRTAGSLGVEASVESVAFADIVDEVNAAVTATAESKAERARENDRITFYQTEGRFVDERTVEVDGGDGSETESGDTEELTAERVVLAGGSRPRIPDSIDGTDEVGFLTSADALALRERPDRLVVVGGGYIAAEMGHFFGAMGTDVVVVGHADRLVDREDRDVAEFVTDAYAERHEVHTGYEVTELAEDGEAGDGTESKLVRAESEDGDEIELRGDEVLIATGRGPNSDSWNVEAAGIDTDEKGFVETDEYLRTSANGVWAIGDIAKQSLAGGRTSSGNTAGNYMFKHSGDKEAEYAVRNAVRGEHAAVEYPGMAHAIFGSPQVGSLGKTEEELDRDDYEVGTFEYDDTALGSALAEDGFAKAIAAPDGEVLGFHVVGPHASMLVHEVATAVAAGGDADAIAEAIHVHPALSEVVQGAFREVRGHPPTGI
ncbi:NAD(P)/FAD-dependent oxidoreductase [Halorussus sp. MSC15.2]|uniref:dihydrolipoyl dehydrogenase family protein n=1 Tax=Halorussus sp. MSC15.2 TaxID=2283638 RepID=UPI0013D89D02|nr:dihydrolipoyl dehydrogenase [Halorussus sp. MSC15.2]NEU55906.1 dihydrolipoyl dehydrogenase [Halorussus sp. MSC15.2]